jgi:hypothetical protein
MKPDPYRPGFLHVSPPLFFLAAFRYLVGNASAPFYLLSTP